MTAELTFYHSQAGVKDVITLFHSAKSPASTRVHTLLKQLNATAVAHATEDQASDHSKQSKIERTEFELGRSRDTCTSNCYGAGTRLERARLAIGNSTAQE